MTNTDISGYQFTLGSRSCSHDYLLPAVERVIGDFNIATGAAFDLGCGNGSVANWLQNKGFIVKGVDPSQSGISAANAAFPQLDLKLGSAYDPLHATYGTFPFVISLEVVEHVYAPRDYANCIYNLLQTNGYALVSTPYHGYFKNLALAVTGKLDAHFTALWDHGHIKFWSRATLATLLSEAGLHVHRIDRVGRVPQFAKSMLAVVQKRTAL